MTINPKFHLIAAFAGLAFFLDAPPVQAEPIFSSAPTEDCLAEAAAEAPDFSGFGAMACAGRAAQDCIMQENGETTLGMMQCFESEWNFWDDKLNAAYAQRLASAKTDDADMASMMASPMFLVDSLRDMQRAWITFRDATCTFERAQWMGGTGGGPASAACLMRETARQALKLEGWWEQ